ncbi:MAG: chemotaxis protein CheA [Xanthomonadaceae bacterium]|nr:chemotaxis protein CheA [Xanthomonadaceae bacterium]
MAIDLARFHATFFEESREGLDIMESGLLGMETGESSAEAINSVFRAAHSIKGGAGTFGFTAVSGFTHHMETLLDGMRAGQRPIDPPSIEVLLGALDVLRGLLNAAEHGEPVDIDAVGQSEARLRALLDGVPQEAGPSAAAVKGGASGTKASGWKVAFKPDPELFQSGNDPLRIFNELERLGPVAADCIDTALPSFEDVDPFVSYLAWHLAVDAPVEKATIDETFAWVEDQCELSVEAVYPPAASIDAVAQLAPGAPGAPDAPNAQAATAATPSNASSASEGSLRVNVGKVDALINLVGELVITQAMLQQLSEALDPVLNEKLLNGLTQLDRNTRDLQEAVMSVRMLPVDFVFSRFPRLARDLAGKLGKKLRLKTVGESTELDKSVIEKITDPLVHLVRNSIDHGIESPEARRAAGKDETGTVTLTASHQGGHIVIVIEDDGAGLNRERILAKAAERGLPCSDSMSDADVWQLIFAPGFSTAAEVTDLSGRGVGMDVVKRNISALGGEVQIQSRAGLGTRIAIKLPLTLAILDGMSVAVGEETYIIPLNFIIESLTPGADDIKTVGGAGRLLRVRGDYLPLHRMHDVFRVPAAEAAHLRRTVVLLESEGKKMAMEVDELVGQQQVVIKSLESNYRRVHGISGATIMGDGRVALIVDVGGLTRGLAAAA